MDAARARAAALRDQVEKRAKKRAADREAGDKRKREELRSDLVAFTLIRHPTYDPPVTLKRPRVTTSQRCTIRTLSKVVAAEITGNPRDALKFTISYLDDRNNTITLNKDMRLADVVSKHWLMGTRRHNFFLCFQEKSK